MWVKNCILAPPFVDWWMIEDFTGKSADGWSNEQMMDFIKENGIKCPNCGSTNFTDIRQFNLLILFGVAGLKIYIQIRHLKQIRQKMKGRNFSLFSFDRKEDKK